MICRHIAPCPSLVVVLNSLLKSNYTPVSGSGNSSPPPIDEQSRLPPPKSHVNFHINERAARVAMWINQNFLIGEELEPSELGGSLELIFASLRNKGQELHFNMTSAGNIVLRCDNMDLCGDIVQALAEYLGLDDLKSTCDFHGEFSNIETLLATAFFWLHQVGWGLLVCVVG